MRSKLEHLTVKDHGPVFGPCHKLPGHTVQKVEHLSICLPIRPSVCLSLIHLSTDALQAKDELSETDERRSSSLKDLRALMRERAAEGDDLAKLVLERFGDKPDSLMLRFLRARKFDVLRAHELMKGQLQGNGPLIMFTLQKKKKKRCIFANIDPPFALKPCRRVHTIALIEGGSSLMLVSLHESARDREACAH